jgi:hypothetical protein
VASSLDPAKEEQLRQAVRQRIGELNQPNQPAAVVQTAPAVAVEPQAPKVSDEQVELMRQRLREQIAAEQAQEQIARAAAPVPVAPPTVEPSEAEQRRLAQEARARSEAERNATRAIVEEQRRAEVAAREAARQSAGAKPVATGFAPMVAPPSNLDSSKAARLAELTQRYKADLISPEEYHRERAKLVAEP